MEKGYNLISKAIFCIFSLYEKMYEDFIFKTEVFLERNVSVLSLSIGLPARASPVFSDG